MNNNQLWFYGKGYYKVYTERPVVKQALARIAELQPAGEYYNVPDAENVDGKGWDFVVPSSKVNKVKRLLT